MSHALQLPPGTDRTTLHASLHPQLKALLAGEPDLVAAMAQMAAAIHDTFGHHWVGFYRVVGEELVIGPYQGPLACARIPRGKGVCGAAWVQGGTLLVPDVDLFPGHIACSPHSRSELVVPVRDAQGTIVAVLDIDSSMRDAFSEQDAQAFERLCDLLTPLA